MFNVSKRSVLGMQLYLARNCSRVQAIMNTPYLVCTLHEMQNVIDLSWTHMHIRKCAVLSTYQVV